jgi:hypothetical protein
MERENRYDSVRCLASHMAPPAHKLEGDISKMQVPWQLLQGSGFKNFTSKEVRHLECTFEWLSPSPER